MSWLHGCFIGESPEKDQRTVFYSNILSGFLDHDALSLNEVSHLVPFRHVSNIWVALRGHGDASSTGMRGKREASGLGGECGRRIEDHRRKQDWSKGLEPRRLQGPEGSKAPLSTGCQLGRSLRSFLGWELNWVETPQGSDGRYTDRK